MVPAWDAPAAMPLLVVSQIFKTALCGQWFAIFMHSSHFTRGIWLNFSKYLLNTLLCIQLLPLLLSSSSQFETTNQQQPCQKTNIEHGVCCSDVAMLGPVQPNISCRHTQTHEPAPPAEQHGALCPLFAATQSVKSNSSIMQHFLQFRRDKRLSIQKPANSVRLE